MRYIVSTRGSQLSLMQTSWFTRQLEGVEPEAEFSVKTIRTAGDRDLRPLFAMDQKGIFEREVDVAVLQGEADFAVHSLKDVPSQIPDGLVLACVPKRETAGDVLIATDGASLQELPRGATIGTSSLRRAVQVRRARPDSRAIPIRGNIETRIAKVDGAAFHGIVLARAGIARLGLRVKFVPLPMNAFIPSPGQGALAAVARADDAKTVRLLARIEDQASRLGTDAERALSDYLGSGCRLPLGAYAYVEGSRTTLRAAAFSVDGRRTVSANVEGDCQEPRELASRAAQELRRHGVDELAAGWSEGLEEWNRP